MGALASSVSKDPKTFLENATPDLILKALTAGFVEGFNGYEPTAAFGSPAVRDRIRDIFNKYGFMSGVDKQTCWDEQALRNYFDEVFPKSDAFKSSIPILWRYFHFHAYFPFPRATSESLDFSAFQRALALIASDGSYWLGIDANQGLPLLEENEVSDRTSSEPSDLWRIYRGLSARSMKAILGEKVEPQSPASSDEEEDLLDVLAFTQPADPCRMTVQRKELRPHAQRILSSAEYCTGYSLTLTDLANLVRVLLSLQVDGSVRNIINKQASIVSINEDNDALNSLTSAVTAKFNVHGREEVKWQTFKEVINLYLPNLLHQLRLVFTTLVSTSPIPSQQPASTTPPVAILTMYHAQYLSFFLPSALPLKGAQYRPASEHSAIQFALQRPATVYSASTDDICATDIAQALALCKSQTLLLLTGTKASAPKEETESATGFTQITFGAYMPTPWNSPRPSEYRADQGHVLFQLEPRQELLEPTDPDQCISELVQIDTQASEKGKMTFGAGKTGYSGLDIDFSSGIAVLRNSATTEKKDEDSTKVVDMQPSSSAYQDISVSFQKGEPKYSSNSSPDWESRMQIQHLEIYQLPGSIHRIRDYDLPSITARVKGPPPPPTSYPPAALQKEQIDSSELAKRIQGFGSTR